ncbi:MAG TPA: glycosyltransferase family 39 protein [Actinocrinis sp.]|jgi:hypothetical protein
MTLDSQRPEVGAPHPAAEAGADSADDGATGRDRDRDLRRALLAAALLAGVVLPLLVAALTGNLSIPHNDAWSYSRIAQTFGRTGRITLLGWNRSSLIGQFVVLGPLASSLVVQQVFVALLGIVTLLSVYDLLRPRLGGQRAAVAVLVLALWPGFGLLATSFMADVPALASVAGSLALGRRALERDSRLLLGLSLAVGLWGSTIRAQSLAAPAAVLLYALFTYRSRARTGLAAVLAAGAAFAVLFVAFTVWHGTLPDGDPPAVATVHSTLDTTVNISVQSFFTLALPLAPAVLLTARPWTWGRAALITALGTAGAAVMALHDFTADGFFLGDYLTPSGAYYAVMEPGDHRVVFSQHVWLLVVALATVSGTLLAGSLVQRWRSVDPVLGLFTAVTAAGTVGTALTGQLVYDRYLIALAPAVLAALLAPQPEARAKALLPAAARIDARISLRLNRIAALAAGVFIALVSFALAANAFSYDSARWRAAQQVAATGVPADSIDAGLEWLGYHAPDGVTNRHPAAGGLGWEPYFSAQPSCTAVTGGLHEPGWTLERTVEYRTFLVAGTSRLYVYSTHATGC